MPKLKILVALLLFCAYIPSMGQHNRWQQRVDYKMNVQLNDKQHTLDAFATINYVNHSPDTLRFIWFHIWPNAYKNDRTAFSDQLLENGRTDFYFSNSDEKGYINRLDFRANDIRVKIEDHPEHIDIIRLILSTPLLPGDSVRITTPFHVQLPRNFSRSGHVGKSYQITQWYPKPAVYDEQGWHPMPYLDQGEFYSEFGNYEVEITIPAAYQVLASGVLQNQEDNIITQKGTNNSRAAQPPFRDDSLAYNTWIFKQHSIHDFAWFAAKNLVLVRDSMQLPSGRTLQLNAAYLPKNKDVWKDATLMMKKAVAERNNLIGEYAYDVLSVVEIPTGYAGGMEYPCIATISPAATEADLREVIAHEIGHNWFQGMIANNERDYAWMDEGINTYYDKRLATSQRKRKLKNIIDNYDEFLLRTYEKFKKDQRVNTPSDHFSEANYFNSVYTKAANILSLIENRIGTPAFDSAMRKYFTVWKFGHPSPKDFFNVIQSTTDLRLDTLFQLFDQKGELPENKKQKSLHIGFLPGTFTAARNQLHLMPAVGYNITDGMMGGGLFTNYMFPSKFQYLLAPLYATKTRELNYAVRFSYTWHPGSIFERINLSIAGMKFNTNNFTDTANNQYITGFRKWVPSLKLVFKSDNPRSTKEKYIQWKSFFIREDKLRFVSDTFANGDRYLKIFNLQADRVLHQLQLVMRDVRALYPYQLLFQAERSDLFTRLNFTGNYYFNFNAKEGAQVRFFAGKFFYNVTRSLKNALATDPFHLNLTGPRGYEDYTYSNYFIGRNAFEGFASQQIMMRDGGFKIRTDLLADKIGKTDNWLLAFNFVSDVPENYNPLKILPFDIPLKVFLDIGTYADNWQAGYQGSKILYNAGLQIPLLNNTVQVYIPLLYSKVYREYINSTTTGNKLSQTITFSIDVQNLSVKKFDKRLPY